MKDRVMELISSCADIDTKKIDIDMTFEELDLDLDDIMELLIPIEEEYDIQNLTDAFADIKTDIKISRFIEMIKENI